MDVRLVAEKATRASATLAAAPTSDKDAALRTMAEKLCTNAREIQAANAADMAEARQADLPRTLVERLRFGPEKIQSRRRSLLKIADLPDPVGQPFRYERRPNGLEFARVRVPLGVVLMIYEARPHVTVNAGAFCLKSGNSAILRGGSEAARCNGLLGELWKESLQAGGLPPDAVQVISGSHADIGELLTLEHDIDLVIPRGGKGLIEAVAAQSRIPVIKHYAGVCHVYLDEGIDVEQGIAIALDSKCLMPGVCNAMETLLVHSSLANELLRIGAAFRTNGVEIRGCPRTCSVLPDIQPATDEDWETEYLDQVVSIRVVESCEAAIGHINTHGSHHTDAIVTESHSRTKRFLQEVDSAVVLVNASTMFCDGESLGMGAEIGISTDKIHARGPMGLEELTSYKFVVWGDGHTMGEGFPHHGPRPKVE